MSISPLWSHFYDKMWTICQTANGLESWTLVFRAIVAWLESANQAETNSVAWKTVNSHEAVHLALGNLQKFNILILSGLGRTVWLMLYRFSHQETTRLLWWCLQQKHRSLILYSLWSWNVLSCVCTMVTDTCSTGGSLNQYRPENSWIPVSLMEEWALTWHLHA